MIDTASDAPVITPSAPLASDARALGMQIFGEYAVEIVLNEYNVADRMLHGRGSLRCDSDSRMICR